MASADSFVPRNSRPSALSDLLRVARNRAQILAADENFPLYAIAVLMLGWGAAIATWGLPALYLPAVVAAGLMLGVLVAITRG